MINFNSINKPIEEEILISFLDISKFMQLSKDLSDIESFKLLNEFYNKIDDIITSTNGYVIKYIGDSAIVIYNKEYIDKGVMAIYELKKNIDKWFENNDYTSRLAVNIHYGKAVLCKLGNIDKLDVIGDNVNTTALLNKNINSYGEFVISTQAYRKLNKENRKLFKKTHLPIVFYAE